MSKDTLELFERLCVEYNASQDPKMQRLLRTLCESGAPEEVIREDADERKELLALRAAKESAHFPPPRGEGEGRAREGQLKRSERSPANEDKREKSEGLSGVAKIQADSAPEPSPNRHGSGAVSVATADEPPAPKEKDPETPKGGRDQNELIIITDEEEHVGRSGRQCLEACAQTTSKPKAAPPAKGPREPSTPAAPAKDRSKGASHASERDLTPNERKQREQRATEHWYSLAGRIKAQVVEAQQKKKLALIAKAKVKIANDARKCGAVQRWGVLLHSRQARQIKHAAKDYAQKIVAVSDMWGKQVENIINRKPVLGPEDQEFIVKARERRQTHGSTVATTG